MNMFMIDKNWLVNLDNIVSVRKLIDGRVCFYEVGSNVPAAEIPAGEKADEVWNEVLMTIFEE